MSRRRAAHGREGGLPLARTRLLYLVCCLSVLVPSIAGAYPLDGYEDTGIVRLEAYRLAQKNSEGKVLPRGAMLASESVRLSLLDSRDFELPEPDPALTDRLRDVLGEDAGSFGVAVLDLTDLEHPVYAEHQGDLRMNPGSVGKVLIALGLFQALADVWPGDLGARQKVLETTQVRADVFIQKDHHEVPFWQHGDVEVERRAIVEGDSANLWTWLDWMLSPSSNAAGSVVLKQAMLIQHFGAEYPVSEERSAAYFHDTPKKSLSRDLARILQDSVRRSGLDVSNLHQGSFFTREGRRRVPGKKSWASSRAWMDFLVALEKGALVDPWSSAQIKKLLYLTEKRNRYASSQALDDSAVFYKSGSLYKCRAKRGAACEEYAGNVWNFMNSIAIVESVGRSPKLRYLVVVNSNVLGKNAVEDHRELATRIDALFEAKHPLPVVNLPPVD